MDTAGFIEFMYGRVPSDRAGDITIWDAKTKLSTHVDRFDTQAAVVAVAQRVMQGLDCYYGVGLTKKGLGPGQRGGKRDVVALPAFFLDVDIKGPGHAKENLPTQEEAEDILLSCPLEPTLVVESGGGVHAYWCVEDPWIVSDDFETLNAQLHTFQELFIRYAATKKLHVDQTGNIDRVLRMPGTSNFKTGTAREVKLVLEGVRYVRSDLLALLSASAAASVALAPIPPSVEPKNRLDAVREDMKRVLNPTNRQECLDVLAGKAWPDGASNSTGQHVCSIVSWLPSAKGATAEELFPIFKATLDATNAVRPNRRTADEVLKWLEEGLASKAIEDANRDAARAQWLPFLSGVKKSEYIRPRVRVGTDLHTVADNIESALVTLGQSMPIKTIYSRAEKLVEIILDEDGESVIRDVHASALLLRVAESAEFALVKYNKEGEEKFQIIAASTDIIKQATNSISKMSRWGLIPKLSGIIKYPCLIEQDRIIEQAGYDAKSGVLYLPSAQFPPVPETPTQSDAFKAAEDLLEWTHDFAFKSGQDIATSWDRSAVAALILTELSMYSIAGPIPGFVFTSPTPGTGKSKLLSGCIQIVHGSPAVSTSLPSGDTEMNKVLLSIAKQGDPYIAFDDMAGERFGTAALSRVLTGGNKITERELGSSKMTSVKFKLLIVASGNNVAYGDTLARRVVQSVVDPGVENPHLRNGPAAGMTWRYPNIQKYLAVNRPRLVTAALTILKAHALAGRPMHGLDAFGSFEEWDACVRSALIWAGLADPCAGSKMIRQISDADTEPHLAVARAWLAVYGNKTMSLAAVVSDLELNGSTNLKYRELNFAFQMISPHRLKAETIGTKFNKWAGKIVEGLKIERALSATRHHRANEWYVVDLNAVAAAKPAPVIPISPAVVAGAVSGERGT